MTRLIIALSVATAVGAVGYVWHLGHALAGEPCVFFEATR